MIYIHVEAHLLLPQAGRQAVQGGLMWICTGGRLALVLCNDLIPAHPAKACRRSRARLKRPTGKEEMTSKTVCRLKHRLGPRNLMAGKAKLFG